MDPDPDPDPTPGEGGPVRGREAGWGLIKEVMGLMGGGRGFPSHLL